MATHQRPPQAHIAEVMHLLEETGLDLLLDVLPEVLAGVSADLVHGFGRVIGSGAILVTSAEV
jgi:ABC-type tungstate transport system substrate-binding protein